MEGIKRIKEMAKGQKDEVLLEIVKYLINRTDMNEYYLAKEKSLKEMTKYIMKEILKEFCKKNNTKKPEDFAIKLENYHAKCLPINFSNEKTFELAIKYFSKTNKELGIEKKKEKKKDKEFGSIFDDKAIKKEKEKKNEIEQISFFNIMNIEEDK